MANDRAGQLIDSVLKSRLVEPDETPRLELLRTEFTDPDLLAEELVRRQWLTSFQAERLLQGREGELVLGPYVLLELLGEGGMGRVFKARHRLMNRLVALKVIREEYLSLGESRQRFLREIEAAARVWHPNLVMALDACAVGDSFVLVMEYVEGTTLARRLVERGLPPIRNACDWARQAALGLHHAHERGLIHRDVKPSNLLLSDKDQVLKVMDLGLARLELLGVSETLDEPLTLSGIVIGTPDYMAPEQAITPRSVGPTADIYGLGCTLFHLLTGRPPFPGGTLTQKLLRHQQTEAPDPARLRPSLPPGLATLVLKMMAKRPENRPSTAAEASELLFPFCSASALKTLPATSIQTGLDKPSVEKPTPVTPAPPSGPIQDESYALIGEPDPETEPEPELSEAEAEAPTPEPEPEPPEPSLPRPALPEHDSWWREEPLAFVAKPATPLPTPLSPSETVSTQHGARWIGMLLVAALLSFAIWCLLKAIQ